jgi:hypothetical protein
MFPYRLFHQPKRSKSSPPTFIRNIFLEAASILGAHGIVQVGPVYSRTVGKWSGHSCSSGASVDRRWVLAFSTTRKTIFDYRRLHCRHAGCFRTPAPTQIYCDDPKDVGRRISLVTSQRCIKSNLRCSLSRSQCYLWRRSKAEVPNSNILVSREQGTQGTMHP